LYSVLSFVDDEKVFTDGGEIGPQCRILVPAVTHHLQQLRIIGPVVRRDRRTKRWRLSTTHTHEYVCPQRIVHPKSNLGSIF